MGLAVAAGGLENRLRRAYFARGRFDALPPQAAAEALLHTADLAVTVLENTVLTPVVRGVVTQAYGQAVIDYAHAVRQEVNRVVGRINGGKNPEVQSGTFDSARDGREISDALWGDAGAQGRVLTGLAQATVEGDQSFLVAAATEFGIKKGEAETADHDGGVAAARQAQAWGVLTRGVASGLNPEPSPDGPGAGQAQFSALQVVAAPNTPTVPVPTGRRL